MAVLVSRGHDRRWPPLHLPQPRSWTIAWRRVRVVAGSPFWW